MSPNLSLWLRRIDSIVSAVSPQLAGETPARVFRVLTGLFGAMGCPAHEHANPLRLPGRTLRSVLMGTTGTQITFPAEAGSENWRVPATRPLLSSWSYTEPNSNHVCSHPVDVHTQPAWLPGWLAGKCCGLLVISGNIQPLPLAIVI